MLFFFSKISSICLNAYAVGIPFPCSPCCALCCRGAEADSRNVGVVHTVTAYQLKHMWAVCNEDCVLCVSVLCKVLVTRASHKAKSATLRSDISSHCRAHLIFHKMSAEDDQEPQFRQEDHQVSRFGI